MTGWADQKCGGGPTVGDGDGSDDGTRHWWAGGRRCCRRWYMWDVHSGHPGACQTLFLEWCMWVGEPANPDIYLRPVGHHYLDSSPPRSAGWVSVDDPTRLPGDEYISLD